MPRIVFRVDGSISIGSGHVVRCATLADAFRKRGASILFLCRELPGDHCAWLESRGYAVHRLPSREGMPQEDDVRNSRAALERLPHNDCLVVDHYGLDAVWERSMRPFAARILAIDDLADRVHDCDVLLDQNYYLNTDNPYGNLVPAGARVLLGPRYALLRSEFAAVRRQIRARDGTVSRVLICFGGADADNFTGATLRSLRPFAEIVRIDVVLGWASPNVEEVSACCNELSNAFVHSRVDNMAQLLQDADLAIGAGGGMTWERACLGVPTLAFAIAANQQAVLSRLVEGGYVVGSGEANTANVDSISSWLNCVLKNPPLLRGLSQRSAALVDGLGAERVADELTPTEIVFRSVSMQDAADIHRWRNDPRIREVSLESNAITFADHEAWLQRALSDPHRILLIAQRDGQALGMVRFDLKPPRAVISVYRVPARLGERGGLIQAATNWLRRRHPELEEIVARVLPDNTASLAAFCKAGYQHGESVLVYKMTS